MKKTKPLFSVIVPTHNRVHLLKRCIQSVLDQSIENWELIIIDDGSRDNTKELVDSFEDNRIHYSFQEHNERSCARNRGIQLSTGDFICFIDDDDYILDNYLISFEREILKVDYDFQILRSGYYLESEDARKKGPIYNPEINRSPLHFAAFNMCGVWSLCFPRGYLIDQKFPEKFPHWQDTHLILRLLAKYPFRQLESYTYVYVIHDQMGSLALFEGELRFERVEANVNAIRDLFDNFHQVRKSLPQSTKTYLVSEKYLGHAYMALSDRAKRDAWSLFRKALTPIHILTLSKLKFMVRFLLATILHLFSKVKKKLQEPIVYLRNRGDKVLCPICSKTSKNYLPFGVISRENAECMHCKSKERHRFLKLFLDKNPNLLEKEKLLLLHISPEKCLYTFLNQKSQIHYYAIDLHPYLIGVPAVKMDITNLDFENNKFDLIICSHVVEHVENDLQAFIEMYRCLSDSGTLLLMCPVDSSLEKTFEDSRITLPDEREAAFGQHDHVRVYGKDIVTRLEANFNVEVHLSDEIVSPNQLEYYGLVKGDTIYECRKSL